MIKYFVIDRQHRSGSALIRRGVLSGIGLLLTVWLGTSLPGTTFEVGLSLVALGFVYLLYLTRLFQHEVPELNS